MRWLLLRVFFVQFIFVVLFFLWQRQIQIDSQRQAALEQTLGVETQKENQALPVRLLIPTIKVDAHVQQVGVTTAGAMEVPDNATDVGWFKLGPRPGERGSAVIAGHFDGLRGEAGVFIDLNKLKAGDRVYAEDDKGLTTTFVVRESRIFDPGYADEVFNQAGEAYLNLITCDGVWEGSKKSFSKRLVVFTDQLVVDK